MKCKWPLPSSFWSNQMINTGNFVNLNCLIACKVVHRDTPVSGRISSAIFLLVVIDPLYTDFPTRTTMQRFDKLISINQILKLKITYTELQHLTMHPAFEIFQFVPFHLWLHWLISSLLYCRLQSITFPFACLPIFFF